VDGGLTTRPLLALDERGLEARGLALRGDA
jgi:hypothetical protein